jgi:hypothetical protein
MLAPRNGLPYPSSRTIQRKRLAHHFSFDQITSHQLDSMHKHEPFFSTFLLPSVKIKSIAVNLKKKINCRLVDQLLNLASKSQYYPLQGTPVRRRRSTSQRREFAARLQRAH